MSRLCDCCNEPTSDMSKLINEICAWCWRNRYYNERNVNVELTQRYEKYEAEVKRLRGIIIEEGAKWNAHHTDPAKKKYWQEFSLKQEKETDR